MTLLATRIRELFYFFCVRLPITFLGIIRGNLIKVHWGRGLNNFGDNLQPDILKHYGFTPVYVSSYEKSDIALAGTILQWMPRDYRGIILGTGGARQQYDFPYADILGVRGQLTLEQFKQKGAWGVVGDPGLIMNSVFPDKVEKKYALGVVPHFVDKNHQIVEGWLKKFDADCLYIDVLRQPREVIKDIKSCQTIVSSSLHGLIIADAFDIPNARFVIRETMPTDFYDYKFRDYYSSLSSVDSPIEANGDETLDELIQATRLRSEAVCSLQERLQGALTSLPTLMEERKIQKRQSTFG